MNADNLLASRRTFFISRLTWSLILLAVSALVSAGMLYAIFHYEARLKGELRDTQARAEASRVRLARAQDDEQEIRAYIDRYRELIARGRTQPERRLDWVEALRHSRETRRLPGMEYEIAPQRPLDAKREASGGHAFLTSPMRLDLLLLHENDLLGTLADLAASQTALVSPQRCTIERLPPGAAGGAQLKAACEIDWITLQEKL